MLAVPQAPVGKFPDEPGSAYTTELLHIADESTHEHRKLGFATRYFGVDRQDMERRVRGDPVSQIAATASQNLQGGLNNKNRPDHYESPLLSLRMALLRDYPDDSEPTKDAASPDDIAAVSIVDSAGGVSLVDGTVEQAGLPTTIKGTAGKSTYAMTIKTMGQSAINHEEGSGGLLSGGLQKVAVLRKTAAAKPVQQPDAKDNVYAGIF